jgi:hypothetical protein
MSAMSSRTPETETFKHFKDSFAYGSRTDLSFKFLKGLSTEDAALFFQELLSKIGDSVNDGDLDRLLQHVYEWQVRSHEPNEEDPGTDQWVYEDGPFAPLAKPLSESRVALFTSSGHFVDGDDPEPFGVKGMTQEEACLRTTDFVRAKPLLSTIPADTSNDNLRVRHPGYDIRAAEVDPNVTFPLERMRDIEGEGVFGELAPEAYSFPGIASQLMIIRESTPEWTALLHARDVDAVLMVPV